jgi:hypothetical protein
MNAGIVSIIFLLSLALPANGGPTRSEERIRLNEREVASAESFC